ncbi:Pentatricopeptide repeat-containing protein [Hirschfeldia incana]|nr:Pentatricopeptide repeat-containing protein [Hirschfeldia incana]
MLKSMSSSDDHLVSLIVSSTGKSQLRQIHAVLLRTSLIRSSDLFHHFLSRLAPRDLDYSRRVFSQRTNPSLSHCNTMIRAFSLSETPREGFRLFRSLRRKAFPPANPLSSSFALKCCIKSRDLHGGLFANAMPLSLLALSFGLRASNALCSSSSQSWRTDSIIASTPFLSSLISEAKKGRSVRPDSTNEHVKINIPHQEHEEMALQISLQLMPLTK